MKYSTLILINLSVNNPEISYRIMIPVAFIEANLDRVKRYF